MSDHCHRVSTQLQSINIIIIICCSVLWLLLLCCHYVALYSIDSNVIMGDEFETISKEEIMDQVRYIPEICLENLMKATTNFGQHDRCTYLLKTSIVGSSYTILLSET